MSMATSIGKATRKPTTTITTLFDDCRTGLPLLKIEDHLQPGPVARKGGNTKPKRPKKATTGQRPSLAPRATGARTPNARSSGSQRTSSGDAAIFVARPASSDTQAASSARVEAVSDRARTHERPAAHPFEPPASRASKSLRRAFAKRARFSCRF